MDVIEFLLSINFSVNQFKGCSDCIKYIPFICNMRKNLVEFCTDLFIFCQNIYYFIIKNIHFFLGLAKKQNNLLIEAPKLHLRLIHQI